MRAARRPGRAPGCHGFCAALTAHHEGEDGELFPAIEFLLAMPDEDPASESGPARDPTAPDPFPAVLAGLMRNRGSGLREFPFVGLSMSTIRGMQGGRSWFCRHLGAVFLAAVPRTTEQLVRAAREADRLSAHEDHGAWQPVAPRVHDCPDA